MPRFYVGTSGFAFKEWKGPFYPADLADAAMLGFYATRFPAVEINNTFYRMPREKNLLEWAAQVPEDFRFALKASQRITHHARLRDVGEMVGYLARTASVLAARLGPTLFQLPPGFKKDLPTLGAFLEALPKRYRAAIEFRHPSWLEDDVFDALRARDVALCLADHDDFATPPVATASWGYARLHRIAYDSAGLDAWAETLRGQPWSEGYVFFKHDHGPSSGPPVAEGLVKRFAG